jgi:NAD(P) transhydrogenase subunit alpha
VPREIFAGEARVAVTPEVVRELGALGFEVTIEAGAGEAASFSDAAYRDAGADVADSAQALYSSADIIFKVRAPQVNAEHGYDEVDLLRAGQIVIGFLWPALDPELLERLAARGVTALSMDAVPRISRAQKLDALSSMANIAGYRAIVEAAQHFGRFFRGQVTAAGKIPPAKVLVIGAGVAGLSAIGTARSMGAVVRAFDTRPEVKEQVESMDAEFLMLDFEEEGSGGGGYAKVMSDEFIAAEMALFREQAADVDIIVTTALIPGKPAPRLIMADMVELMRPGSVIVDLAGEQGGNCELTVPGEAVVRHGVTIIGYTDLPSRLAAQSSQLYATNLRHMLTELSPEKDGNVVLDLEDEVIRGSTVTHGGEVIWPPPRKPAPPAPPAKPAPEAEATTREPESAPMPAWVGPTVTFGVGALLLLLVGQFAPASFLGHFTVFVLACFVGYMVVWNVTPALHTPLMSVTNAISSIVIIGGLVQISGFDQRVVWLAVATVLICSINIFGGFAVTRRMLAMFRK